MECYAGAMLQPLDVVVSLALTFRNGSSKSFEQLGGDLGVSASTAHRSLERARQAGLVTADRRLNRANMLELLIHGVRFVYYVKPGELTRGISTAHAAPPLSVELTNEPYPPVWPDPQGDVRGQAIAPLHDCVPGIARKDQSMYEVLALVDAIRIGGARQQKLAAEHLRQRLKP